MFTLSHLTTPPPESLKSQVLQMVVDYFSDISPAPLTPSNPLYQLYQYVIGFEVHLYLQAMGGEDGSGARLILALDDEDPSRVLGFALYLPSPDDADTPAPWSTWRYWPTGAAGASPAPCCSRCGCSTRMPRWPAWRAGCRPSRPWASRCWPHAGRRC